MRRLIGGALGALGICVSASAQQAAVQALYQVCVNGRCVQAVPALVEADGRPRWIAPSAFEQLGLDTAMWPERLERGRRYVDALSAYPQVTSEVDPAQLQIRLTLPPQAWPSREYPLARRAVRPSVAPSRARSAYLDYTAYHRTGEPLGAYGELGLVSGTWLARSSFRLQDRRWERGLTSLGYDQYRQHRRWILGDTYIVPTDPFGTAGVVAGLGVESAYDLDPEFVRFPGADVRGVMSAPGDVEVYANGRLVGRRELGPGPFTLQDLVLTQGANDLRIVVRDPFAGTYEFAGDFYGSVSLLAPGMHDYGYRVGYARPDASRDAYGGELLFSGQHRYGFASWLTAGLRYEQMDSRFNVGASADLRLPFGALSLALARGDDTASSGGWARRIDYSYQSRHFAFSTGWQDQDLGYISLQDGLRAYMYRRRTGLRYANLSFPLSGQATFALAHSLAEYAGEQAARSDSARLTSRIPGGARLYLEAGRRNEGDLPRHAFWQASLVLPLERALAALSVSSSDGENNDVVASTYRSRDQYESGTSYRAEIGRIDDSRYAYGELENASHFGIARFDGQRLGDRNLLGARFTGSLVWAGGEWHPVLTGTRGHALVRTPGSVGVPVLRDRQPAGMTGKDGSLLIPGLLPYHASHVAIDQRSMGLAQQVIGKADQWVNVGRHGVAYMDFAVQSLQAAQVVLQAGPVGSPALIHGRAWLDQEAEAQARRIGTESTIYFDHLEAGDRIIRARSQDGALYRCELRVPALRPTLWKGEAACASQSR